MIEGSIFNRVVNKANQPHRLKTEMDEFDVSSAMMESLVMLEESSFSIIKDHMTSIHIGNKDGGVEIIQEGFNDFIKSAAEFFKNMLKKFKDFMLRIFMYIRAYIGSFDKFLDKYKDRLKDVDPEFSIKGFKFTFSTQIPKMDKIQGVINSYNSELNELDKLSKEEILKEREEFTSDNYLNGMRAYIIGEDHGIESSGFRKECEKVYKGGDEEPTDIDVNKSYMNNTVSEYNNLKNVLKDCSKERDKVILLISSMQDFFQKGSMVHYKGADKKIISTHSISVNDAQTGVRRDENYETNYSDKSMDVINTFFNFKYVQAKEIGFACMTAMSEKVNCLKLALKQSETIIRKCILSKPVKKEGEPK